MDMREYPQIRKTHGEFFEKSRDVLRILDVNGNVVVNYTYDPWGKPTITGDEELAALNPCSYRGYDYDEEMGYYYLKSRYFDPVTARFISVDTPENAAMSILRGYLVSGNLYVYCGNAPVNASDPSGYYSAAKEASWLITALFPSIYALKVSGAALIAKVTAMIVAAAPYLIPIAAAVAVIVISTYSQRLADINRAHTKIQTNVKKNGANQYWVAYRSGDYVVLKNAISYQKALSRVKSGKSVFTTTREKAYALAYAAGNERKPVGPEKHGKKNMPGYYYHYHVYGHGKAHVWYLFS